MEVFTDGRIEPREALQDASRQLMDILGLFTDGYQGAGAGRRPRSAAAGPSSPTSARSRTWS